MMRYLPLVLLLGCTGADDDDDDDDDNGKDDSEETTPAFVPAEGEWTLLESTITEDDCDLEEVLAGAPDTGGPQEATFTLQAASESSFEMVSQAGETVETFTCNLKQSDKSFECPSKDIPFDIPDEFAQNTQLVLAISATGTFSETTFMQADQTTVARCEGEDCATIEQLMGISFPCTIGVHSRATME